MNEPPLAWQSHQHQRILRHDVTAFAELCEAALPHLVAFLQAKFPASDPHLREQAVIDGLLTYQARPSQYDPQKLPLFSFLRMVVRRDLLNALAQQNRHNRQIDPLDDPVVMAQLPQEDVIQDHFALDEWLQQYTNRSRTEIMGLLEAELGQTEREILWLMLEGIRETPVYANIMGINHLDVMEQRHEVKKAKDRILKKVQRLGQKL